METPAGTVYQFGPFEVDTAAGELLKQGKRISLQEQPFRLLVILLENSGEVVSRAEIQSRVWGADTFVDFDSSLRVAVGKLRSALGDDATDPRYIETIPRRGYRFLGPATRLAESPQPQLSAAPAERAAALAGLIAALLGILVVGLLVFFRHSSKILTAKDTIVLGDFVNSTGDPVFDETLRQGLAVELEQSPYLSLISDQRIQQTLRLMVRPPETRLTSQIAREVCERTASAAVLEGSIARLGSQYVLGLRAENCRNGEVLAEEQAQASRKEDVLNALSRMAGKLRARLGESLQTVEKYNAPLEEMTTPSLQALKFLSAASRVGFASGSAAAIPFLQHAIEIDPSFAMAYSYLGRFYGDIGETELSAQYTSKAYELRDRTSEQERFWITANYDTEVLGNLDKAAQNDALWLQAYPRALAPHGLMAGTVAIVRGDYATAIREDETAVAIDPDFPVGYCALAQSYAALGNINAAENTLRRVSARNLEIPDLALERYAIDFLKGDQAGMAREVTAAQGKSEVEEWLASGENFGLAYSGRLQEASKRTHQAEDLARASDRKETVAMYETDAALQEALFGFSSAARTRAITALGLSRSRGVEYGAAVALSLAGDYSQSAGLTDDLGKRFPEDTMVQFYDLPTLRGLAALQQGKPAKALELLQTPIPYELGVRSDGGSEFELGGGNLFPAYVRGQAYLAAGQGREAAQEFQKILDHPGIVVADPIGALAHLELGRAYLLAGDKAKANSAYRDFLTLWKSADADIPILKEAKAESARF